MFSVRTHTAGPILDGRAGHIMERATEEAESDVADYAVEQVRLQLGRVLRHPTGEYMSRIHAVDRGPGHVVNDRDSVKGPWLEGVSRRNATTRFKGYHTFRIVSQRVDANAERVADPAIDRGVRRIS